MALLSPQPFGVESYRACGVILCSSGTTGLSKGVLLSHAQCIQMTRMFDARVLNPTMLCFSSLYWLSGFTFLLYSLANLSRRVITKRPYSPLLHAHLIEQYRVNILLMPPSQIVRFVKSPVIKLADLSSVRLCFIGGGALDKEMRETMQDHLLYGALMMTYGMTELGRVIAATLPFQKASNSVGKIGPNVKLKVTSDKVFDNFIYSFLYSLSSLLIAASPKSIGNFFHPLNHFSSIIDNFSLKLSRWHKIELSSLSLLSRYGYGTGKGYRWGWQRSGTEWNWRNLLADAN